MESLLVKQFDRTRDQEEVARLLGAGCTHMRKAFDIEDLNLDELIARRWTIRRRTKQACADWVPVVTPLRN